MKSAMTKCAMTVAAIALMFGVSRSTSVAADPTPVSDKGIITGVVMHEGKPVAGAVVRLMEVPVRPNAGKKNKIADPAAPAPEAPKGKRKVIAEVKTDAEGKFTMNDIPAGNYVAMSEDSVSKGVGRKMVTVEAGKTADISVDIKPRPERGERPAKGEKKPK